MTVENPSQLNWMASNAGTATSNLCSVRAHLMQEMGGTAGAS
eukprot:CAMPEP_0175788946 /NCGR_PEP_ID=MMETSP0097-20121207/81147_1 /TAXON_ID=311494 /ORGANISM="Alexandrium monilatum, Strain CCMP3105" /LENGTH=41 /DNA_ID= /DNA_START= /DNA_END= /DNA_ORIENTATION=